MRRFLDYSNFKKFILLLCLVVPFSLLVPYIALNLYGKITMGGVPIKPIPVTGQYKDAFNATCGVHAAKMFDPFRGLIGGSGTGIVLNTGYIITNKHVVDSNRDGTLSNLERKVQVTFSSISSVQTGTVIYASDGHWRGLDSLDFAIIAVPNAPKSNIQLISNEDYEEFFAGRPVFAIGRSMGQDPPHFTKGIRSTDIRDSYHRASISIFYGNSGGGLFSEETGELIGICSRIALNHGMQAPDWAEYIPPTVLRNELQAIGLHYVVDKQKEPFNWSIHVYSGLIILVLMYGLRKRKGGSGAKVRSVPRDYA